MIARVHAHTRNYRSVLVAAAVGLGVAIGPASAKSPMAGNPGANQGQSTNLGMLLEDISTVSERGRNRAADAFVAAAVGAEMADVIAAAVPALEDVRDEQRYYALVGLGAAGLASTANGEQLAEVAQALVSRFSDENASVREAAAATLAAIQPTPPDWAAGPLTDLLDDPEPRVAAAAMRALERLPANYVGFDGVYALLDGDNPADRSRAARVLGAQGNSAEADNAAWALVGALYDPDANVRWQAATAFGALGDAGMIGLTDLYAISRNKAEAESNRRAATTAINTILD